eukprot:jgi/Ulvmu1/1631/UM113_0008.1
MPLIQSLVPSVANTGSCRLALTRGDSQLPVYDAGEDEVCLMSQSSSCHHSMVSHAIGRLSGLSCELSYQRPILPWAKTKQAKIGRGGQYRLLLYHMRLLLMVMLCGSLQRNPCVLAEVWTDWTD